MKNYKLRRDDVLFLFIDYQEGFLKIMTEKEKLMKNAKVLANVSKIMDIPSIFTVQYKKGLGPTVSELKEILPNVAEYDKNAFSAMLDENIAKAIKDTNKKQVIISGIESHICVLLTTRDLLAEGYEVFVVNDSISSRSPENYLNALSQLSDMGAVVTNVETIIFDLSGKAGTEEFKKAQSLII